MVAQTCRRGHRFDKANTYVYVAKDGGRVRRCRACQRRRDGQRQLRHRENELRRRYGITPGDYDGLLAAQGGVCAICEGGPGRYRALDVDHDHETGQVRGLLCRRCNLGLTYIEREGFLQTALRYLGGGSPS